MNSCTHAHILQVTAGLCHGLGVGPASITHCCRRTCCWYRYRLLVLLVLLLVSLRKSGCYVLQFKWFYGCRCWCYEGCRVPSHWLELENMFVLFCQKFMTGLELPTLVLLIDVLFDLVCIHYFMLLVEMSCYWLVAMQACSQLMLRYFTASVLYRDWFPHRCNAWFCLSIAAARNCVWWQQWPPYTLIGFSYFVNFSIVCGNCVQRLSVGV